MLLIVPVFLSPACLARQNREHDRGEGSPSLNQIKSMAGERRCRTGCGVVVAVLPHLTITNSILGEAPPARATSSSVRSEDRST